MVNQRFKMSSKDTEMEIDEQQQNVEMAEDDEDEEGGIRIGDIYLPPPPPPACTFDSTGPRLIITHIENEFFKSYAGRQVLGPFHKSFTSIVGPNGSGKSNVIDSMLFVFGYRAQKIRSKKISVLIHNSETYPNVESCTVAVYFQKIIDKPGDAFDIVPNSQFVVSRTAYKDNSSFYKINDKRCQFKAVAKLLRSNGIDLDHNRFLILQGEVEQISLMKPKAQTEHDTGMLEYLEDIIGSSRFKEPIEILFKRVEELNGQRVEKLNRVKLVEKERDELEEPKNEAVAFLKMENDLAKKKNLLYQRHLYDFTQAKNKAEEKKKTIDDEMADMKNQLKEIDTKKKEKEAEMRTLKNKLEEKTKLKEKCNENFKKLESEDVKSQEELNHKNQMRKKIKGQLKKDREKLEELEKVPEKSTKAIEECEKLREKLETSRKVEEEVYHEAMDSLNSETQQLQEEKVKYETKLIDLRKEVDETKSALNVAQFELDMYLSTEKNEKKKLDQIKESLQNSESLYVSRKEEIKKLDGEIPINEKKLTEGKEELQHVIHRFQSIEKELKSAKMKLEESRSAMQSSRSRGRVIDALLQQKDIGNLPGVLGRLGDLGGIDQKYDVAVSTACGALDNIVVDNVQTGQNCINFLKKNNIGTASFIALDKMEKWRSYTQQKIQTPENVPRLFDLVKVKSEKIKTAFYFALRDTLVADDLNQASRIAYGRVRNRVVTLSGQLIEISGTMSGGGRSVLKGRMGKSAMEIDISPKEIEASEMQVDQLTTESVQLRHRQTELEDLIKTLERDLITMKLNVKKYSAEIGTSEKQTQSLKVQLEEQKKKIKSCQSDPSKVSDMEQHIGVKQTSYNKATSAAQEIEEQANKVHKQIMEMTGGRMKGMKKKLEDINKQMVKVNQEITRLQVAIKTSERDTKNTRKKISSLESEIEEVEQNILGFQAQKAKIEEEAANILKELNECTEEEHSLTNDLEELKNGYDVIIRDENEVKSAKIEFDQEIEKYDGIIKENKAKISHWKKELNRLELQEILIDKDETDTLELRTLDENELEELDAKTLGCQVSSLEDKIQQSKPNLAVLAEYRKKEEIYLKRVSELEEMTRLRDEQRKHHEDLRKQRLNEFMSGFTIISNKLKEMYQMITLGGDAELELVDSLDPFSEGIVFSVRPPKKSWKNITNLSGGEKTLSSLALVFALHYYKPTPLYVMDEIDAALDFKNVSIVGNYIKERTKNAQFVIVSLRSQMFELADRLVGIYKTYNCTKSITINPSSYEFSNKSSDKKSSTESQHDK